MPLSLDILSMLGRQLLLASAIQGLNFAVHRFCSHAKCGRCNFQATSITNSILCCHQPQGSSGFFFLLEPNSSSGDTALFWAPCCTILCICMPANKGCLRAIAIDHAWAWKQNWDEPHHAYGINPSTESAIQHLLCHGYHQCFLSIYVFGYDQI